ncbi:MAG: AraC family transcriptional regulator [Huintestinicola sp.]|uniref:AraC family transcriptional regulator n=1 Tax=Huintestinicola sp. TaxID=2981661 RepID=UPI003F055C25
MFFCDYPIIRGEKELPLFLLNMGQQHCQDHIIRTEGYPCHQILYCTKGGGTLLMDNKAFHISPYTAIFMPAFHPHEYYPDGDIWDIHWVVPAGFAADDILKHFGLSEPKIYELNEVNMLEHIFRKMHEAIRADSVFGNYRASGYLYDFLIEFYRLISSSGVSGAPNSALMKALDHINFNYASPISMNELCAVSGVSKQYLCLLFRKTLGSRPMEYIAKRRIQAAKELLTGSDKTIEEIASETGFCTASYFCKLFKRYEGMTPSHFKKAE